MREDQTARRALAQSSATDNHHRNRRAIRRRRIDFNNRLQGTALRPAAELER